LVYDDLNDFGTSKLVNSFHQRAKSTTKIIKNARHIERSMTEETRASH
jgi:hypothetical protein